MKNHNNYLRKKPDRAIDINLELDALENMTATVACRLGSADTFGCRQVFFENSSRVIKIVVFHSCY